MALSRREFSRLVLGSGAVSAMASLGLTSALAQDASYRALVTIFLYGGNDGFNTLVPTDAGRYQAYASARGDMLALPHDELLPLAGTDYGMHPSFQPLRDVWEQGDMSWVLNVGTLVQPLTRELFRTRPDLRPDNLGSHSHEQEHWHSMRPGSVHPDGVFGRMADRIGFRSTASPLISVNGASLALMGNLSSPLVLPLFSQFERVGYDPNATGSVESARNAALAAFANERHQSIVTRLTANELETSYAAGLTVNPILVTPSPVDAYFADAEGNFRDTPLSRQLRLIARMIHERHTLGHQRQIFMAGHGDYDTHANQVSGLRVLGAHADLLSDLASSIRSFYNCMNGLGLNDQVALMTMADFGRTFKGNDSAGSDHGWGNAHFVVGGALQPGRVHGAYPTPAIGGPDDAESEGTWIPTVANEEYFAPVAQWFGVPSADMDYVLPNWSTWNGGGRGPVPLFG